MGNKHFEKGGEPLKTLNDCKYKEEARQEAVKWVKERRIDGYNEATFMEFFNLTEEDLK